MADPAGTAPEYSSILSGAKRRSRLAAIVALAGIVVVFASLVTLYVVASNRAALAEQREQVAKENARTISDQLERIRSAYARGDMARVGVELGVAVTKAEDLAADPNEAISAAPTGLTARQALEISTAQPDYNLPETAGRFPQTVYIQFAGDLTRAQITALNQALRESGWAVQGASGERIATADGLNEIRYSADSDERAAAQLAAAINRARITSAPVRPRKVSIIKPGVLEVWISG